MSQMRVKALKGEGKTVSRKARKSGRASGTSSPGGSELLHRVFHQDDASYRSESEASPPGTPSEEYSVDEVLSGAATPEERDGFAFAPKKLIEELKDRKSNHNETRELLLESYVKMLRNRYEGELENFDTGELAEVFLRGANRGTTPRERRLSLQAYSLTVCISNDLDKGEAARASLKKVLTDDDDEECQIQALYGLTVTISNYGGGENDIYDYLDFLIEAIQSNGETVNAINRDGVMVALFESWAFAATQFDIWAQADYSMDAFVEKLDSTDTETQTAAAECIAFIFEASRAHEEEEGEPYELPYDPSRIASRIDDMTKGSTKSMSRKTRRDLRECLRSVVTSLERGVGPYYSTAQKTKDSLAEFGYRFKIRKHSEASSGGYIAHVESWHHYVRIAFLRNVFRHGLERHIQYETPMVIECLEGLDWHLGLKTDLRGRSSPTELGGVYYW